MQKLLQKLVNRMLVANIRREEALPEILLQQKDPSGLHKGGDIRCPYSSGSATIGKPILFIGSTG